MKHKALGQHGPQVSAQGLGCMGMSIFYGQPDDASSIRTIHRALDLGVNMIVTSDAYGNVQHVGGPGWLDLFLQRAADRTIVLSDGLIQRDERG